MFKSICITIDESRGNPLDIGFLAETLLFYEKVYLVLNKVTLKKLLSKCDIDTILLLLQQGHFKILIKDGLLGIFTQIKNDLEAKEIVIMSHHPKFDVDELIFQALFEISERQGWSRRNAQKLLKHVEIFRYQEELPDMVRSDFRNELYLKKAVINTLQRYDPKLSMSENDLNFEIKKIPGGFTCESNIDFEKVNSSLEGITLNSEKVLLNIMGARDSIYISSTLDTEIATDALTSKLISLSFNDLYRRCNESKKNLSLFNEFTLDNAYAIRDSINSDEKSLKDFAEILEKSQKFRVWLQNIDENGDIIKEYHRAVTAQTWLDKLPTKALRWSFFTGGGLLLDIVATGGIGTAIGLGLSISDSFLLDKIKNWKPNQFVDSNLKSFIKK